MTPKPDNRDRILACALELFSARSYHTVTVDEIAQGAGVSKGGVFHHFGSKHELASVALVEAVQQQWDSMQEITANVADPAERLRLVIDGWIDLTFSSPSLAKLILDLWPEMMQCPDAMTEWMPLLRRMEVTVASWLEECDVPNPGMKAMLLVATVDDLSIQGALLGPERLESSAQALKRELYEIYVGNYVEEGRSQ